MRWSERVRNYILGFERTKKIYESVRDFYIAEGEETRIHSENDVLKRLSPLELRISNLTEQLQRSEGMIEQQKHTIEEQTEKIGYLESLAEEEIAKTLRVNYFTDFASVISEALGEDDIIFIDTNQKVVGVTPHLALFLGYQNPSLMKGQSFSNFVKYEGGIETLLDIGEFKTKKLIFSRRGKKTKNLTTSGIRFELSGKVVGAAFYVKRGKVGEYLEEIYKGLSETFEERSKELIYQLKQRKPAMEM